MGVRIGILIDKDQKIIMYKRCVYFVQSLEIRTSSNKGFRYFNLNEELKRRK